MTKKQSRDFLRIPGEYSDISMAAGWIFTAVVDRRRMTGILVQPRRQRKLRNDSNDRTMIYDEIGSKPDSSARERWSHLPMLPGLIPYRTRIFSRKICTKGKDRANLISHNVAKRMMHSIHFRVKHGILYSQS